MKDYMITSDDLGPDNEPDIDPVQYALDNFTNPDFVITDDYSYLFKDGG